MSCDRVIEVEDWTLGLLSADEATSVAAHVATCAACQDAKAMFSAERLLFAGRPSEPPPRLVLPKAPLASRLSRIGGGRMLSAVAALAACIMAVVGGAHAFAPSDCVAPAPSSVTASAPLPDEPLTCKAPPPERRLWSELTPAVVASQEPPTLACVDRATCEAQESLSFATP